MRDKQTPIVHSKGINKNNIVPNSADVSFALNATRASVEGRAEYQSEPGNEVIASLPSGYFLVGSIYGQKEEVYLFSSNNSLSEIGIFKQGKYTTLANLDLGFSSEYPITGEYRMRNGCERCVYWTDFYNPDYYFNIDRPELFKTGGNFDPNKFKFNPDIQVPNIDLKQINSSGGTLPLGSYYFQVEIVDINGNSFYKSDITPQTIIYDDDQSDSFNNIDGGLNAPQYDPAIGGLPSTTKSITLTFSNLDTSFGYLRVNVIRKITANEQVDAHQIGQLIPISSSTIDWTYTGYNPSAGDFLVDYSSLVIPDVKYSQALVQEQVQGRLLRANVRQETQDYSTYQSFASVITAQWVAKEVEVSDQFASGNPKNPNTYWNSTSFQGDEIYAFGIQYLLKTGEWTPVFHIPGRHTNSSDLDTITVVSNASTPSSTEVWESDVEHLGLGIGDTLPRWKAFNTASITTSNTTTHPYDYIGEFGYYESDTTTYPDIRDCDNSYIWGLDSENNQINTSTKIRYHRFPDRRLVPHLTGTNGEYIQPLGVKFDNITYPSADIVGHRFCHAVRSDNDKTVLDSGWAVQPPKVTTPAGDRIYLDANFADYDTTETNGYVRYNSAEVFYNKKIFSPDHLKLNHAYHIESFSDSEATVVDKTGGNTLTAYSYIFLPTAKAVPLRTNHAVNDQVYVEPLTYTSASIFAFPIQSVDQLVPDNVIRLRSYYLENSTTLLSSQTYGGANITDPVTGTLEYNNFYVYKKQNRQLYENLLGLSYNYVHFNPIASLDTNDNIFYGGDTIISLNSNTKIFWPIFAPDNILQGLCYTTFYEEHGFNCSLRLSGTSNYYYSPGSTIENLISVVADLQSDDTWTLKPFDEIAPEYFRLNTDFSVSTVEQGKVSLPLNYNYCSDCLNEYPNRIIWSPKSFEEESFDLYRISKINDYIDLPAHRGKITGLCYQDNRLLVHTEDTTFILHPNPQQIATDDITAYLTTGDFLGIPPQELVQTDIGFGGLQSKQSQCNTPFGHFWVDQKRGEIIQWNGRQPQVISNNGLEQWCREYLPSEATKLFYEVETADFPVNSSIDLKGVGLIVYYDPRFKRVFFTKKDYLAIDQSDEFVTPEQTVVWSFADMVWKAKDANLATITVTPDNPQYFEDKSWTLSYSPLDESFVSWHSYIPRLSFTDSNFFYTTSFTENPNELFQHLHKNNFQNFYGVKYDFILEYGMFTPNTMDLGNIFYIGRTENWNDTYQVFSETDATFDKLLAYNDKQSTGLQTLILQNQHTNPYQNNKLLSSSKFVIKTDDNYKIAGLFDYATAIPVISKTWTDLQTYSGYIDILPANINFNKSSYSISKLKGKNLFVRLFFKPEQDYRKTIIFQILKQQESIR